MTPPRSLRSLSPLALLPLLLVACGDGGSSPWADGACQEIKGHPEPAYRIRKCRRGDRCVGAMPHPSCPASVAGVGAICAKPGYLPTRRAACGDGTLVVWSGGTEGFSCHYDGAGALVATRAGTDSPSFCGGISTWSWGAAPIPEACFKAPGAELCPGDAGAPGGDATAAPGS